jgi:hypothetical protein
MRISADLQLSIKAFAREPHRGLILLPNPIIEVYREQVVAFIEVTERNLISYW